ncbi:hypothetical protein [Kriegella aquimaris]|uniref:Outer membrane lipoprotein carrier protein LolA n=1 Tax=Kriegella aquimaris TaxID=192904 RepID=A0A1G9WX35_9FLAO|nr:hypothetical protein [Kriegella aquimaris]SDM89058.1 hypothetical protein SAMN04488514_11697 [Kriegella aquimaris]
MKTIRKQISSVLLFFTVISFAQITPEQKKMMDEVEKKAAEVQRIADSLMNTPQIRNIMANMEELEEDYDNERQQQSQQKKGSPSNIEESGQDKWSAILFLDGKRYNYDIIDKDKSKVFYDEGIWIELRQDKLPEIIFEFPTIERWSAIGQYDFKLPDFNSVDGREPITLYFVQAKDTIVFKNGAIKASLRSRVINVEYEGFGGDNSSSRSLAPIKGSFHATLQ